MRCKRLMTCSHHTVTTKASSTRIANIFGSIVVRKEEISLRFSKSFLAPILHEVELVAHSDFIFFRHLRH